MSRDKKYKISEELFLKFASKDISEEEANYILDALKDPDERKNFVHNKNIMDEITLHDPSKKFDTQKAISNFLDFVENEEETSEKPEKRTYNLGKQLLRIAAIFLITLGIGAAIFLTNQNKQVKLVAESNMLLNYKLPDGSTVDLKQNTALTYSKKFNKKSRELNLLSGEAYFNVEHIEDIPFVVKTPNTTVQVLGTEFNVQLQNDITEVTVNEGKVEVQFEQMVKNGLENVILEKGQKCTYSLSKNIVDTTSAINLNELTWATGKFVFNDSPLEEALRIIAKEYNYKIDISVANISNCIFTAIIRKSEIQNTLEVVTYSADIETKIENNTIYVTGYGCDKIEP